ncbi:tetratricopeptide repeat protein [Streptomyces sp. NPDC057939]|uniref:tetratricopeptide repeat protein n=1 Tax=Streptomyces sp. NPDC057939 TaxID=3346284 RepID=UPI0036E53B08
MTPNWFSRKRNDDLSPTVPCGPDKAGPQEEERPAPQEVSGGPGGADPGRPGSVTAGPRAVAAGGNINGSALGENSTVNQFFLPVELVREVSWPLLMGAPPPLASSFQPRSELRERLAAARDAGTGAVLTQARPAAAGVLSGMGGVGKSQLAAQYAHQALAEGTELVMWVPAGESTQIITLFGQAALRVRAVGATGEDPEQDARMFLEWLATTSRSWLVVLDDISDVEAVRPWWPPLRPGTGFTLATTRLHDPRLTGGGRVRIDVDVYTPEEACAYLSERVVGDGGGHLLDGREGELARALGYLPLAMGHAAAYLLAEEISCADYLERLGDRTLRLEDVLPEWTDTESYQRQVTAGLLLSLAAAEQAGPVGVITQLVRMLALMAADGHPESLWTSPSVTTFLTTARGLDREQPTTEEEVVHALRILRRYALITIDPHSPLRQIRMHALTARAVRETTPTSSQANLAITAADALEDAWPPADVPRDVAHAMRTNTIALRHHAEQHLWTGGVHPVIFLLGFSLRAGGLHQDAHDHWLTTAELAAHNFGADNVFALNARSQLAASYHDLGRHHEALTIHETVRTDIERVLGPDHPAALTARANLATAYLDLGRHLDALTLQKTVLADTERLAGPEHRNTLHARANLAAVYRALGRQHDALSLGESVLADRERLSGPEHPDTLHARANLAATYRTLGRPHDARALEESVLADRERLLGPEHPDTLHVRGNLATTYSDLGRNDDALTLQRAVLADRERLLGPEHPDTLQARANLAATYTDLGRYDDALLLGEAVLADRQRLLGAEHPDTLHVRANLAVTYSGLGRQLEALALEEAVCSDTERLLGPEHPNTLHARANLAVTYRDLGRYDDALTLQEAVLADSERLLGAEHPDTLQARTNLAAIHRSTGRHHNTDRMRRKQP